MNTMANQKLSSIVTENYETAAVLEKHHLDFCCKGNRTLADACQEKNISLGQIVTELECITSSSNKPLKEYSSLNAGDLINEILQTHHTYVKQAMPEIEAHLQKVAEKHGDTYPYLKDVQQLFVYLKNEMYMHMHKEEAVLFPRIKELEPLIQYHQKRNIPPGYINAPVSVMEHEHDEAGEIMVQIRKLTKDYTPPEDACTTFKLVLQELQAFEQDLHKHVHLENNLLFPMGKKMLEGLNG